MKQNFNFKLLGHIDTSKFVDKLKLLTDEDWKEFDFRQKTFDVHVKTLTIPILFNQNFSNFPNKYKFYSFFEEEVNDVHNFFITKYGDGKIVRFILVKLLANCDIPTHVDGGDSLSETKRHHIAIITNPKVSFTISDETKHLKQGEVWEINNLRSHSVENLSDQDRIHIIVDWLSYEC